jgi:uncharacterized protein
MTTQSASPFTPLLSYQFISLTTFRKSGAAVPTTVWFAPDQENLYVTTGVTAGKLKRLRHTQHVVLTPCDARGTLLDERIQIEAVAHELPAGEHDRAVVALKRKYGEQFDAVTANSPVTRTYIEITAA